MNIIPAESSLLYQKPTMEDEHCVVKSRTSTPTLVCSVSLSITFLYCNCSKFPSLCCASREVLITSPKQERGIGCSNNNNNKTQPKTLCCCNSKVLEPHSECTSVYHFYIILACVNTKASQPKKTCLVCQRIHSFVVFCYTGIP